MLYVYLHNLCLGNRQTRDLMLVRDPVFFYFRVHEYYAHVWWKLIIEIISICENKNWFANIYEKRDNFQTF